MVTLPVYSATLGRQSGPTVGYNSLDGIYADYANSFPVGEFRNDYRVRFGTLSGWSAEDILSERIADHVVSLHLGRKELLDINGVLVGVDQWSRGPRSTFNSPRRREATESSRRGWPRPGPRAS
ncbi:MAG: hypothetical protein E6H04_10135 [Bacillati bacterium ANGP1]|uniref:Uncharacterized protein n=1 Tax=Candidatus Segetimicrobium genomatis TaxID=2569760 RepID=A0A537J882_9BACT|nr:MAG: hypothetical protein E6H04_10135 [Terrabacteria group bacterium ANGP1]